MSRPETGAMQFTDDWPGIFIRGDNALAFEIMLRQVKAKPNTFAWVQLGRLRALLVSCRDDIADPVKMKPFEECEL